MPGSDKLAKLQEYHALVKQVLAVADKEVLVARVVAAHIGYWRDDTAKVSIGRAWPAASAGSGIVGASALR